MMTQLPSTTSTTRMAPFPFDRAWAIHEAASLACLLEASASKVGNVTPSHAFEDMAFSHFAASATAIGHTFQHLTSSPDHRPVESVGTMTLELVRAMMQACGTNTYLGTILLFAPLAHAAQQLQRNTSGEVDTALLQQAVAETLLTLTPADSADVYESIRIASAGGLGSQDQHDVQTSPAPTSLVEAMLQVASFDAVARQFTNGFGDVFHSLLPWLAEELSRGLYNPPISLDDIVCRLQLRWMSHEPDGLIWRKLGEDDARQVQFEAKRIWNVVQNCPASVPCSHIPEVLELDRLLREQGNRRNPGTTADLIAATLFVHLLTGSNA
ncbi:MAG: triphosphoribosyl-dephospho-CoA synthase [Planctomycetota bacterium]